MKTKSKGIALAFNVLILFFEILGFAQGVSLDMFVYYTNLSNLIALTASALMVAGLLIPTKAEGNGKLLTVALWYKYMAACMTTVTLIVVLCILVPMQGFGMIYKGNFLYFHLICPLLMMISTIVTDPAQDKVSKINVKQLLLGLAPTLVYATVTIIANIVGALEGPYPFLMVRSQPVYMSIIWAVVVLGIAVAIAYAVLRLKNRRHKA